MKKQYILRTVALLICAVSFTWMVKAQDQTPDERLAQSMADSIAMNKALKETIADKERLIERQNSQSEELQNELRNFSGMQNVVLLNKIEDTAKVCKSLEEECEALIITCNRADSVIAALNCELEPLRPFRESQLTEKMEYTEDWASMPFSQLDSGAIRKVLDDCDKYGGNNADIKKIAGELRTLQKDLQLYSAAWGVLTEPFNESGRRTMRRQLDALLSRYEDAPQQGELIALDELLRDYDGYVYIFQDFINRINDDLKDSRRKKSPDQARFALEKSLGDEDQISNMENIRMVPYLKDCLDEYLKALERDPLKHWAGEKEILEMVK